MSETAADRLRVAVGLHALGVEIYRQRRHREHPGWGDEQLDDAVRRWLAATPLDGSPSPPERHRRVQELIKHRAV